VVNEALAKRYWPNQDPVGQRIALGNPNRPNPIWREIVGVVGNVKYFGLDQEQPPALYLALPQMPQRGMTIVVRTSVPPLTLASGVRQKVAALEPNLAVPALATMDEAVSGAADQSRLLSALTGAFALMALILAGVGLYGVMAYIVLERTREMGIRLAIGATPSEVLRMMMGQGIKLALFGVAAGLAASLTFTRILHSFLFDVGDRDPVTFVSVALLCSSSLSRHPTSPPAAPCEWIPLLRCGTNNFQPARCRDSLFAVGRVFLSLAERGFS